MGATHDYDTTTITAAALNSTHVLVGESGGLSAVFETEPSHVIEGTLRVETEHGSLYLDPDDEVDILGTSEPGTPTVTMTITSRSETTFDAIALEGTVTIGGTTVLFTHMRTTQDGDTTAHTAYRRFEDCAPENLADLIDDSIDTNAAAEHVSDLIDGEIQS